MASVRPNPACPDRPYGRHPALVTADRMLDAAAEWGPSLTGRELQALNIAQSALRRVGEIEQDRPKLTPAESVAIAIQVRSAAVAERDVELAMKALAILGDRCPKGRRRVAEARIADPEASWTEIAARLGLKPNAAAMSFRRLCESAGLREVRPAAKGGE